MPVVKYILAPVGGVPVGTSSPSGLPPPKLSGTLGRMAHTISDRTRERRDAEFNGDEIAREVEQQLEDNEFATSVVDIWNSRLAEGRDLFFTPTIGAAIRGGKPLLGFYCPACGVTGTADLRVIDRHPAATVASLIPALSCQRCRPYPPFARLTGLAADPTANPERAGDPRMRAYADVMAARKARGV